MRRQPRGEHDPKGMKSSGELMSPKGLLRSGKDRRALWSTSLYAEARVMTYRHEL